PESFDRHALCTLDDAGIRVGQGLRTGCNRFFYVRLVEEPEPGISTVVSDPALGGRKLSVPSSALQPVLHRQADLEAWRSNLLPATRVLDLRLLVLPEDFNAIRSAAQIQRLKPRDLPALMPNELAAYVREAANTPVGKGARP